MDEPEIDPLTGYYSLDRFKTDTDQYYFEDYQGKQALSYYTGMTLFQSRRVLPPLWSVQIYVTYPDPPIEDIAREIDDACGNSMGYCFSQRLDVYALEHASIHDCMRHYDAEKRSRENTARAIPSYDPCENGAQGYFVFIEHEDWKSAGVTLVGWDEEPEADNPSIQECVKIDAPQSSTAGEDGFLIEDEDDNVYLGNLGDALVSLWPMTGEDPDYASALAQGKRDWGDGTFRRSREAKCINLS